MHNIDGHKFSSITAHELYDRFPQYSMTNDPEKVWPGGIVHYLMDTTLGKFKIIYIIFMFEICFSTILLRYVRSK